MSSRTSLVHFRGAPYQLGATTTHLLFEPTLDDPLSPRRLEIAWKSIGTVLRLSHKVVRLSWIQSHAAVDRAWVQEVEWIRFTSVKDTVKGREGASRPSGGEGQQEEDWLASLGIHSYLLRHKFDHPTATSNTKHKHMIHILRNPTCADQASPSMTVLGTLLTLLGNSGYVDSEAAIRVHETRQQGDGTRLARDIVRADGEQEGERTVVVMGGDGTVGEVVNGLLLGGLDVERQVEKVNETGLILVPLGTANALYHHHFPPSQNKAMDPSLRLYQSLLSFLHRGSTHPQPLPLSVASNTIPSFSPQQEPERILTLVVTSTALHANILFDAEKLRSTHPGLERFKIAASGNATRWFDGKVRMSGAVRRWDKEDWVGEDGEVRLEGPWVYCVTSLVSRFEKEFVVAPLRQRGCNDPDRDRDLDSTVDVILIRPLRDPITRKVYETEGAEKAKEAFAPSLWETFAGMYQGGKHVRMEWSDGQPRVEYYRCQKVEWEAPDSDDIKDRLVCLDGLVRDLGREREGVGRGRYVTTALGSRSTGLKIWA